MTQPQSNLTQKASPISVFFKNSMTQVVTLGVLILLCVSLSFLQENFFTASNLINVVLQASAIGILAIGMSFVIFSGGIDLSVGSVMALCCTIIGDLAVTREWDPFLSMFIGILIGAGCGALSGLLICKINMPPFIVTLGAMMLWRGVALEWVDGVGIYGVSDALKYIGSANWGPIPVAVVLFIALVALAWIVFRYTSFGMHTYAIGDNEKAAKLSGIKVDMTKILVYTLSGISCAIAAIVVIGRMGGSTPIVGQSYELEAIAGVAIGGASMSGGVGSVWGTLIGVLIVQVIRNGMNMLALSPYFQQMIIGVIIILSVGIDCFRRRKAN